MECLTKCLLHFLCLITKKHFDICSFYEFNFINILQANQLKYFVDCCTVYRIFPILQKESPIKIGKSQKNHSSCSYN